jgi:uncharacterized membrane protein YhiD involved in acid resistance
MGDILNIGIEQNFSVAQIAINLTLTFALSFLIALVYKKTHRGLSYSQSFVFTLILMSIIVTVVMMVIGNSLARAFGLLGAFSIIRFRTAVKDTKDISYIFFALGMGMAVGTNNYSIAVVSTIIILLIILLLSKINFGSMRKHEYLLSFTVVHGERSPDAFEDIFRKYLKNSLLLNINSKQDGTASEMTYNVNFVDQTQSNKFVRELSSMTGVEKVHLITSKDDVEY